MAISVLAVAFLIIIGFITLLGYKTIIKGGRSQAEIGMEKCTICRARFAKEQLLLRQVGDYKMLYFCKECILRLYVDLGIKN